MAAARASGLWIRTRQAARRPLKEWRYSLWVVVILGVGIGPAAVGLTVVDRVLLRPLAYPQPDRIGVVRVNVGSLQNHPGLAQNEILNLRQTEGTFKSVEWVIFGAEYLDAGGETVSVSGAGVSPGLFEMLGVSPVLGRSFRPEDLGDARASRPADVVMLSHHTWRGLFGGDPTIVGRTVTVFGVPRQVVGVLPPGFTLRLGPGSYVPSAIDLWSPVRAVYTNPKTGFGWGWNTIVRLQDGVSFAQANASLQAFAERQRATYPKAYGSSALRFTVSPLLDDLVRDAKPAVVAALVGVVLLLIAATVNASALLVVALKRRREEFAVRSAIGGSRGALLIDVWIETLALAVAGGAVGGGLAVWGIEGLRAVMPREVPRWETITFTWETAALPALAALLVLVAAAGVAVWWLARGSLSDGLASVSARTTTPRAAGQAILVGFQISTVLVLLFGAVQLTRSVIALARTDLGFEPRRVVTFQAEFSGRDVDRADEHARYLRIRERLAGLPGVVAAGAISSPPLSGRGTINTFTPDGTRAAASGLEQAANFYAVLPGYFDSVRTPILRGRDFTDAESEQGVPVAIIDDTLARTAFPGQDPIGRTLGVGVPGGHRYPRLPDPRIIGIVAHARVIEPTRALRPQVYLPFGLWRWAPLSFAVRTENDPRGVIPAARAIVKEIGKGQPITRVRVLSDDLEAATAVLRAVTALVVALALSAALLASLGLYAFVSYVVFQERRATAIRLVLGASPDSVLRMQLKRVVLILACALPAGIALCVMGARFLGSLIYGVAAVDAGSLAAAAALGAFLSLLAAYIPARQATAADPASLFKVG